MKAQPDKACGGDPQTAKGRTQYPAKSQGERSKDCYYCGKMGHIKIEYQKCIADKKQNSKPNHNNGNDVNKGGRNQGKESSMMAVEAVLGKLANITSRKLANTTTTRSTTNVSPTKIDRCND